jgi:magnesium transporter
MVGIIDVNVFTEGLLDLNAAEPPDTVFETLGFHASQVRGASMWKAFRFRFPWLLATIGSGTIAAFVVGLFEHTLQRALVVTFFLALVLALADAVSIQSMTLAIQTLRSDRPTRAWFFKAAWRELGSGLLLGFGSGLLVFLIAWAWRGTVLPAAVIGMSIAGAGIIAAAVGLSIPSLLHALKLDPKIAAGPITLAIADMLTLLLYLSFAKLLL